MKRQIKDKKGFTLMEMLIVVAIIAVLVAIAIPTVTGQLHNAKVAADWANVRAYYAELQLDYMTTGTLRPATEVPDYNEGTQDFPLPGKPSTSIFNMETIVFLNKQEVRLQAGSYVCTRIKENGKNVGYHITYYCNEYHSEHNLTLG